MENALRRGELADVKDVYREWADMVLAFRSKMRALPLKLAPQVINVSDPQSSLPAFALRSTPRSSSSQPVAAMADLKALRRDVASLVRPPPDLTVSQWADEKRRLSSESSAEPGIWRTDRAPYQRGIMDAITDPRSARSGS
jgi:hypothetical protein